MSDEFSSNDISNVGNIPPPFKQTDYNSLRKTDCITPKRSVDLEKKSSKHGCLIGAVVVACLGIGCCGILFLLFLGAIFSNGAFVSGNSDVVEEVLERGEHGKIVVIDIKGVIGGRGLSADLLCKQLKVALNDNDVCAVILDMDTPGGGVTASDEIAAAIQRVRQKGIPVVTCMHGMGASGGYLIACGTDYIFCNSSTLTGSFGVIMSTYNYAELLDKIGVKSVIYKSGSMKDFLNGGTFRSAKDKRKMDDLVQELIRENFRMFAKKIADGRERYKSVSDVLGAEFSDGRVLSGNQALRFGLVDKIGYFDDAVAYTKNLVGDNGVSVVHYTRPVSLRNLFMAKLSSNPPKVELFPRSEIEPGRLYYILPTVLQ